MFSVSSTTTTSPPTTTTDNHSGAVGTWPEADSFCTAAGMTLPLPLSAEENAVVTEMGETWLALSVNSVFQRNTTSQ